MHMLRARRALQIALALLALMPDSLSAHQSARTLRAVRVERAPTIDGVFDDEAWAIAPVFSGFVQRDPEEGAPATERTEVQLAYDDEALYRAAALSTRAPISCW